MDGRELRINFTIKARCLVDQFYRFDRFQADFCDKQTVSPSPLSRHKVTDAATDTAAFQGHGQQQAAHLPTAGAREKQAAIALIYINEDFTRSRYVPV